MRNAEGERRAVELRFAARRTIERDAAPLRTGRALDQQAQRDVRRQPLIAHARVGERRSARAVSGTKPRRVLLDGVQRRCGGAEIDAPQLGAFNAAHARAERRGVF